MRESMHVSTARPLAALPATPGVVELIVVAPIGVEQVVEHRLLL